MARVAANSYGSGEKYAGVNAAGKNEFVRGDGSRYTVGDGIYTSPSGKVSEISGGGKTTTTLHSRDERQNGNVYQGGALVGGGVTYDDVIALANQMAGNRNGYHRQDIDGYLLRAMAALGYGGSAADFAGDVNLYGKPSPPQPQAEDPAKLESAAAEAARSAYVSRMLKDRDAQQGAAYSGNNRGLRVFDYR